MKKILIALIAVLALSVSCNLDSEQGIYDAVQDARPQDSNTISNLAGRYRSGDTLNYVFNTTKGIALNEHTNLIPELRNDNGKAMYFAVAVDSEGNILLSVDDKKENRAYFAIYTPSDRKITKVGLPEGMADKKVKVYQSANFYENAYDVILQIDDAYKLCSVDDLEHLTDTKTAWTNTDLAFRADEVYPILVGHKAYVYREKGDFRYEKPEDRVINVVDADPIPYVRNKDHQTALPLYLYDDVYVFAGKLYDGTVERKTAAAEEKDRKSLDLGQFFYTIEGDTVTGTSQSADSKVKMFQYDRSTNELTIREEKDIRKEVLGIRANGSGSYNLVLVGDYRKEVRF